MVKPAFENLDIGFWVHSGKLGSAKPSLCLFHNELTLGAPILEALNELKDQSSPAQRTLTFAACSRKQSLRKLKLLLVPESEELRVMNIRYDADAAIVEMALEGIVLVIEAVTAWLKGAEDFGVSPRHSSLKPKHLGRLDRESGELWFWGPIHTVQ